MIFPGYLLRLNPAFVPAATKCLPTELNNYSKSRLVLPSVFRVLDRLQAVRCMCCTFAHGLPFPSWLQLAFIVVLVHPLIKTGRSTLITCSSQRREELQELQYFWVQGLGFNGNLQMVIETTLNYRIMMVERYPNLKEEFGGLIFSCEIYSLLDGKLVRWSNASCALALACRPSISKIKINIKNCGAC